MQAMSDEQPESTVDVRSGGKARASKARNPLPWYRRGIVWLVFVLVTSATALWVSYAVQDDDPVAPAADGAPVLPPVTLP